MRTLAFDGRMGASGDMLLGALVAAGADPGVLAPVEDAIPVEYVVGETTKNGIHATTVDVVLSEAVDADGDGTESDADARRGDERHDHDAADHGDAESHDHDDGYGHHHDRPHDHHDEHHSHAHDGHGHSHDGHDHPHDGHTHGHGHSHDAADGRTRAEGHGPHRSYAEVVGIVEGMALPAAVERDALAVFELLGEAEASVHGTDLDAVHFHEVGADDAIADVVGVALLLADLGVEHVVTTPVATGDGTAEMSHGTYPVPAPAVVELAARADWSLRGGPVEAELLTPTGAAILAHYAEGVERLPTLSVEQSGYGAGGYDFPEHPNVLRALVGEAAGGLRRDPITVLETNLDDATPEELGSLQTTLKQVGARDVTVVPATMKKSRPGHLVKVVVKPGDAERVAKRLATETGTLGVREHGAGHRFVADRRVVTTTLLVDGERHEVRVKVGTDTAGTAFDVSAEHDDALAVAEETGLPLREVTRRAEATAREGGALDDVLVHVVEADRWAEFADAEAYATPSLDEQGFVHLSTAGTVLPVAQFNHADDEDPRLLLVDRAAVEADLRFEEMPDGRAYPHLYADLPTDAVRDVVPLDRDDAGRFRLPEVLETGD